MQYFIDVASYSVNKHGEELCGDNVEHLNMAEGTITVLSDGLGSGVKANIQATLTSKIAITMLKKGASIEETIDTITKTLPECNVRKLAYSTFTIIKVENDGTVYMVEYDNPSVFFYRDGNPHLIEKVERIVNNKLIYESRFQMIENDVLTIVSDGVVHAGIGEKLNLGWQWEHVNNYLTELVKLETSAEKITQNLMSVCENLYANAPGDDTTIITIKTRAKQYLDLFTGPPKDPAKDQILLDKITHAKGKVILSGGTTANIVSEAFGSPIEIDLVNYTPEVPPMGHMKGVELVTEGLLTLNKVKDMLLEYYQIKKEGIIPPPIKGLDGASHITRILIEESTHIHLWVGTAVNPAHQNPDFPGTFNLKIKSMKEIKKHLKNIGKTVEIDYL